MNNDYYLKLTILMTVSVILVGMVYVISYSTSNYLVVILSLVICIVILCGMISKM